MSEVVANVTSRGFLSKGDGFPDKEYHANNMYRQREGLFLRYERRNRRQELAPRYAMLTTMINAPVDVGDNFVHVAEEDRGGCVCALWPLVTGVDGDWWSTFRGSVDRLATAIDENATFLLWVDRNVEGVVDPLNTRRVLADGR